MSSKIFKTKQTTSCRLRTGDEVVVIAGKSKGEKGKINKIDFKNEKVFVSDVNTSKRHTKPGGGGEEGGILDKVMPLPISNVMLVDPKNGKRSRVGYKIEGEKKVRFSKSSGTILEK